jgi:hypothetical protein
VIKWKKAKSGKFIAKLNIITLNCLNVDKAIIFFKSNSFVALSPAISIVREEEINRSVENRLMEEYKFENRIRRKTPAVTSVEECTSADTGVGAAIAAGSQLENGN